MKTRRLRIDVTSEDIAEGIPGSPNACPIALALRRRGYGNAQVGHELWRTTLTGVNLDLSKAAARFVDEFDELLSDTSRPPLTPRTFFVEAPWPTGRMTA